MIKRVILSLSVIVSFGLYAFALRLSRQNMALVSMQSGAASEERDMAHEDSSSVSLPSSSPELWTKTLGGYKDGVYTSPVEDAFYGDVQIKLTVHSGKIANIQFLKYPNDRHQSVEVNQRAMPRLKSETIQAQSGDVNIITGATQTSLAFREALRAVVEEARL